MKLFQQIPSLEVLNQTSVGTATEALGIQYTEIGEDYLKGTMPVDHRTIQPARILHGGASVLLAETLGSTASMLVVNFNEEIVMGLDINANHLRPATSGYVTGTARPIHIGKTTHVWEIRIENDKSQLVCISRLTMAVRAR